ncbi:MAG TPA: GAF domain-containing sensor histidine kinase [Anaerolineaceae bacterium]|nr:GAF domain-containing sensor histidine kinase [Anaerolineaceae bacterium]
MKNHESLRQFFGDKRSLFLSLSSIILIINFIFVSLNKVVNTNDEIISYYFLFFIFPHIIGLVAIISGFVCYLNDVTNKVKTNIPVIFSLLAILLVTSTSNNFSQWIQALWVGCLVLFVVFLFDHLFIKKSTGIFSTGKTLIFLLTVVILLTQLVGKIFTASSFFQTNQLLISWSILLLLISWIYSIYRITQIQKFENMQQKDFFVLFSSLSLFPLSLSLIYHFPQPDLIWWYFSSFLGLLWFSLIQFHLVQKKKPVLGLDEVDGFSWSLHIGTLLGFLLILFANFDRTKFDSSLGLFVGVYIMVFSLGLYFYLFQFKKISKQNKNSRGFSSDLKNFDFDTTEELNNQLRLLLQEKFSPINYNHFFFDPINQEYITYKMEEFSSVDINFQKNSPVVQYLSTHDEPLVIEDFSKLSDDLLLEKETLILLDNYVFIPLKNEDRLLGWISLTQKPFNLDKLYEKIQTIKPIIDEYEQNNSKLMNQKNLVQREKNFNVLSRIVQGVNYTLGLDDIYELIYAQITQIIPSGDFYIIQKEENSSLLRYVFFVENSERIHQNENQLILLSETFEAQVVGNGLGIIANNYLDFCKSNRFDPLHKDINNALIAPLNTGAATNGCITIANRNPNDKFTNDQLGFLQSIADLVAGAIEKAKLLQKSEDFVHQLSLMNNLVRKLSSTLNLEEMYRSILLSINELIAFDKGRLFIVNQINGDITLMAHIDDGILLDECNHKFEKGEFYHMLIQNKKTFFVDINQNRGASLINFYREQNLTIHSLVIIPMVIKDNTIGIIEMINKKESNFFTENEKQLLQAFSSQATITIENTSLYLQTDQELADRLEELSTMQQIDRELNASLDIYTTLKITLFWAMKVVNAGAGLIGLIKDDQITHRTFQGFEDCEGDTFVETINTLESEWTLTEIPHIPFVKNQKNYFLHHLTQNQVFAPIYREDKLVAIIILEMFNEFILVENVKRFLERLSDHASIAIINSQLYEEVQKANYAKSEFVSLVAHELKNPMTSIKGYTELLSTGTAGEISTTQANFLSIIQSNTERMNTLVSDLNDLTKIEAGSLRIEPQEVDLEKIFSELRRNLKKHIDEKQQKLTIAISEDVSQVWADPNRLLQILLNLVSNASKYTPVNGNIELFAAKKKNSWSQGGTEFFAHIGVKDDGVGISEQDQELIFHKFFRSEDPAVRATSGTGLGLNITKNLVEMQGGRIWFESEHQKGTTFHFVVPLVDD